MLAKSGFLDYVSAEESNLKKNLRIFADEFKIFERIDTVYERPLSRLRVSASEVTVPQLYALVHSHYYFSFACLLRIHLSESLSSVRSAIDATLSAYEITINPEAADAYINRHKPFLNIKGHIKKAVSENPSAYPLSHGLLDLHETCSSYGSHADINTFFHRLHIEEVPGEQISNVSLKYFQLPENEKEYRSFVALNLSAFFMMFLVFYRQFFKPRFKIEDTLWEREIKSIYSELRGEVQLPNKYPLDLTKYFKGII